MVQKAVDETTEVLAERMRDIISLEFDHRVKNLLTTVSTIARRTAKSAVTTEEFIENFDARIDAMARTHQLLVEGGWDNMSLENLLSAELKPYLQADHRKVVLAGPAVTLTAKQAETLGMAFHELATNAAKYGALKDPDAVLDIRWSNEAGTIMIDWSETGLHGLRPPKDKGFGSVIIEKAVPTELSGSVKRRFLPGGLHCRIEIPRQRRRLRLDALLCHPVFDVEILARMRDQLAIARMIDGFDALDQRFQLGIVLFDMGDQFGLGLAGPEIKTRRHRQTTPRPHAEIRRLGAACPLPTEPAL